jgi:hypothetical protein
MRVLVTNWGEFDPPSDMPEGIKLRANHWPDRRTTLGRRLARYCRVLEDYLLDMALNDRRAFDALLDRKPRPVSPVAWKDVD